MIFLALDFGARRIGLSISDEAGRLAFPLETQQRGRNDTRGDLQNLLRLIRGRGAQAIVLGIPGGSAASDETAAAARAFAAQLDKTARQSGLELAFFEADERFSTAQAHSAQRLTQRGGAGHGGRSSRGDGGAESVDARAAAIFLQTFLDARNFATDQALDAAAMDDFS